MSREIGFEIKKCLEWKMQQPTETKTQTETKEEEEEEIISDKITEKEEPMDS